MTRNFKYYSIGWGIALIVFNVIIFCLNRSYDVAFWTAYAFVTISFIGQLICTRTAFKETDSKKFLYNIPLITISYSSTILSVILSLVIILIPNIPAWAAIVISVIALGANAISVVKAKAAADIAADVGDKVKAQTLFVKSLTVDVENLISKSKTEEIKAEVKKVYEAVRYSDPMSNDALSGIESQITLKFSELSKAVADNNFETVKSTAGDTIVLVEDRNKKCMILK